MDLPLLMRAAGTDAGALTTPKTPAHMSDWNASGAPSPGTGIPLMPSILRSGIATNPLVHAPDAASVAVAMVPRIPKGSGEVVEDSFH